MNITVDGKTIETTSPLLSTIIGYTPTPTYPVVVERMTTKDVTIKNTYEVDTTKGVFTIETYENSYYNFFSSNLELFKNMPLKWTDKNTINFGTFQSPFDVTRKMFDYEKMDVLLGLSGFEKTQGTLTIAKRDFFGKNGIEKGAFGKVIKGRHIIEQLDYNDIINSISKKQVRSELYDYKLITEDTSELMDNDNIITKMIVKLYDSSPYASEHFLFLVRDGTLKIDSSNNTYAKNTILNGISLPGESILPRKRGSLSVRVEGKGKGNIFAYYTDMIEDKTHSVFGEIVNGIELIQNILPGQNIRVETLVKRLNTLGRTQIDAMNVAKQYGIEQKRTGDTSDDAIVISQTPELSVEAKERGFIETEGVTKDKVFTIELNEDKAPETSSYFKTITGLKTRELGRLTVFFSHEDLDMILFEGNEKLAGTLVPENPPIDGTKKGRIGITNMASRQKGVIGVRFSDSIEYGPTGEDIDHTNCLGKIINYEKLRGIKEGDTIYILTN